MVQLRMEAADDSIPKDCYISVRVGEVQKLSRLSGSRTYKFPQAAKQRFGKIEVFRRIGSASIDLEPALPGEREVQITCTDAAPVALRLAVDAQNSPAPDLKDETEAVKQTHGRVQAAKEYLNMHSLEILLSEAMQAVLRERPENPAEVLADKLKAGAQARGPYKTKAPQAAAVSAKPQAFAPPYASYFANGFRMMPDAGFGKIHARFPEFAAAQQKAAAPQPSGGGAAPADVSGFRHRPSVGTWLMSKPTPLNKNKSGPPSKSSLPQAPSSSFRRLPSVGTWFAARLVPDKPAVAAPPAAPKLEAKTPMHLLPSSGTWLAKRTKPLFQQRVEAVFRLEGLRASPEASADERAEAERVLTKALLELSHDFAGDYYPLAGSDTCPARPGGMTAGEESELRFKGMMFTAPDGDAAGRGVFAGYSWSIAAEVNGAAGNLRLLVLEPGAEGLTKLQRFQDAVTAALRQEGYALV